MADVKAAVDFVLRQEDSTLSGIITNTPGDLGGTTRFGLARKFHPELDALGFFDPSMPSATALPMAERYYADSYATPLMVPAIRHQSLATALLSFAINQEGPGVQGKAVSLLQQALLTVGAMITADGAMGQHTVNALNMLDPVKILAAYCELQQQHYEAIVAANPSQAKFLAGWTNRVKAVAALAA